MRVLGVVGDAQRCRGPHLRRPTEEPNTRSVRWARPAPQLWYYGVQQHLTSQQYSPTLTCGIQRGTRGAELELEPAPADCTGAADDDARPTSAVNVSSAPRNSDGCETWDGRGGEELVWLSGLGGMGVTAGGTTTATWAAAAASASPGPSSVRAATMPGVSGNKATTAWTGRVTRERVSGSRPSTSSKWICGARPHFCACSVSSASGGKGQAAGSRVLDAYGGDGEEVPNVDTHLCQSGQDDRVGLERKPDCRVGWIAVHRRGRLL